MPPPSESSFSRATLLTQNKKLKKKRKYLIHGLTKENVSARFRFSFLSIVCWCFLQPRRSRGELLLQKSPQLQPHPADTQPPCESEGRAAGCWGYQLKKKGGHGVCDAAPAKLVGPRTVYVGMRVQITQKWSLADCSWMAYEHWNIVSLLLECQFHLHALSVDLEPPGPESTGWERSALLLKYKYFLKRFVFTNSSRKDRCPHALLAGMMADEGRTMTSLSGRTSNVVKPHWAVCFGRFRWAVSVCSAEWISAKLQPDNNQINQDAKNARPPIP